MTLGVRDLPALQSLYEALGWESRSDGDQFARFEVGGAVLALYSLETLAEEAGHAVAGKHRKVCWLYLRHRCRERRDGGRGYRDGA